MYFAKVPVEGNTVTHYLSNMITPLQTPIIVQIKVQMSHNKRKRDGVIDHLVVLNHS